jgi:DNA-binding response OmpR family regulator
MSYILIVDDDATMAQTLADMVSLFDWKTTIVHGPRPAMHFIQNNPPALILLDLNMPGVDGMEVCRFIKRDPIAEKTMVVFVTAEDDPSIQQKAREAGAADYLVKPVDIDRLEIILDKLPKDKDKVKVKADQTEKVDTPDKSGQVIKVEQQDQPSPTAKIEKTEPTDDKTGQAGKTDKT